MLIEESSIIISQRKLKAHEEYELKALSLHGALSTTKLDWKYLLLMVMMMMMIYIYYLALQTIYRI